MPSGLPAYFFIRGYEVGARQAGTLQYEEGSDWVNIGNWVANSSGIIIIDATNNPMPVPYYDEDLQTGIFYAGGTWRFRLADIEGHPLSNIIVFTLPNPTLPLLNLDGTPLLNTDGNTLLNS